MVRSSYSDQSREDHQKYTNLVNEIKRWTAAGKSNLYIGDLQMMSKKDCSALPMNLY